MSKLSAEQRIERTHVQLMKDPNFCLFSGLFMIGKVEVRDETECGTAQTNGLDVIYDRAFIDRLNDKQVAFLVLHENMHKAYRHLVVWHKLYKENGHLANVACDYVINLQIRDYDPNGRVTEMPTDEDGNVMGCIDEAFRGMDAHEVYNLLVKKYGKDYGKAKVFVIGNDPVSSDGEGGKGKGEQNDSNVEKLPEGFDSHDWDSAQDATQEEQEAQAKER